MSQIAGTEFRQPTPRALEAHAEQASKSPLRRFAAWFWLTILFWQAAHAPWIGRTLKPIALWFAFKNSRVLRSLSATNARRIFGPNVSAETIDRYGRGVIDHFFEFIGDIARSLRMTREQLRDQVEEIIGHEFYLAAREPRKGAIIATAHMGSFEAGAAALRDHESAIHVVFKRDQTRFEQVRSTLRQKLGVIEAPIDDGLTLWLRLREALERNEVVMMQADRVMPGQKGLKMPFLHGHLMLPTGPLKLALASGAPIIPIFALRAPSGKIRIHVEPAIWPVDSSESPHPALAQFATVLEKYVRAYPDQWLLFHPAFCEDAE